MAVKDTPVTPKGTSDYQELYASPALIRQIKTNLKNLGSAFKVKQGTETLRGPAPNSWRIFRWWKKVLYRVQITNRDIPDNCTFEACNANMWHLMGVVRSGEGQKRVPYTQFESQVGGQLLIESLEDTGIGMKTVRDQITGLTQGESRKAYRGLDPEEQEQVSRRYGINQYASPKIGEGLGIFSTNDSEAHFAGVIAKSGNDIVVLENYAGNPGGVEIESVKGKVNPNWFLRMFGPVKKYWFAENENQTFHGEHVRLHEGGQHEYGGTPIVVRVTSGELA
jgi:hypothetical protein